MTEPPASKPPASTGASTTAALPSEATASAGASTTPASPSEAPASVGASTTAASSSEVTASTDASTTSASPSEATDSLITEERVWQLLKEKWKILRARITMEVERIDQLSKRSWKWRFYVKPSLTIIMVVMKILGFLIKNLVDCRHFLWGFIKGAEKSDPDKFWEENAYDIIRSFGTLGAVVLLVLAGSSLFTSNTSAIAQSVYYFFIFVGVGIASAIATWRGRQSEQQIRQFERQLENSRFEKAVDMASDLTNVDRREMGFLRLMQMLATWEKNFDDATEEKIGIITSLAFSYFGMNDEQMQAFVALHSRDTMSYGKKEDESVQVMFRQTPQLIIDTTALELWEGVMNWNRKKFDNPPVNGIYAQKAISTQGSFILFSRMNLKGIQFLVVLDNGEIDFPTKGMYSNFKLSCFIEVDMYSVVANHVNFFGSHFFRINHKRENLMSYKMSCVGTIFDFANLIDCNFRGTDFKDASFVGTNVSGSDFRETKNLTPEQFQKNAYWIRGRNTTILNTTILREPKPKFPESFPDNFADTLLDKPSPMEMIKKWEMEA